MSQSFYYGTDSELSTSGLQFAAHLVSDPAAYGVTEAQASEMQEIAQAYAEAYAVATAPQTRTTVAVEEKRARKRMLTTVARRLGNLIIGNPAVSDAQLVELGLKPRLGRSRIGRPESSPVVRVLSMQGHRIELAIRDPQRVGRGKPAGVAGAMVWTHIGDEAPQAEDWTLAVTTSRTNTVIEIPRSVPPGSQVRICAAWFNNRQQAGLSGPAARAYVQFGGPVPIEAGVRQAA